MSFHYFRSRPQEGRQTGLGSARTATLKLSLVDRSGIQFPDRRTRYNPFQTINQCFRSRDNNVMHTKPDLRVFLKWLIARSGSVITDVMRLGELSGGSSVMR